jgi:hypothetical protein
MKRAAVTVIPQYKTAYALALMSSVKETMPGWERIIYIVDAGEGLDALREKLGDSVRIEDAKELFEKNYYDYAFFFEEPQFVELVKIRVLQRLLKEYDRVMLCDPCVVWNKTPSLDNDTGTEQDVISKIIDVSMNCDATQPSPKFILRESKVPDIIEFTGGDKISGYLDWCSKKFGYIFSNYYSKPASLQNVNDPEDQSEFAFTWVRYSDYFDIKTQIVSIPSKKLSPENSAPDISRPEAVYSLFVYKDFSAAASPDADGGGDAKKDFLDGLEDRQLYDYFSNIIGAGEKYSIPEKYGFDCFADGTPVIPMLRPHYTEFFRVREFCAGNPFAHREQFTHAPYFLGDRSEYPITVALYSIWSSREDLRAAFPYPNGQSKAYFISWFVEYGMSEYNLPHVYGDIYSGFKTTVSENSEPLLKRYFKRFIRHYKRVLFENKPAAGSLRGHTMLKPDECPNGINLVGFINGDFGLGEATRILARIFEAAGIDYTVIDFRVNRVQKYSNHEFDYKISNEFKYNTTVSLVNINGGTWRIFDNISPDAYKGRYNIGYFYWELPEITESWSGDLSYYDEIWTASEFNAETFRKYTPHPVTVIPCALTVNTDDKFDRDYFGLPKDKFLFLLMYDSRSSNERKNPAAAVAAFERAFGDNDGVRLVLKVNMPSGCTTEDSLLEEASTHSNILFISKTMTKTEVNSLNKCCDAFVSLHRSEGFRSRPGRGDVARQARHTHELVGQHGIYDERQLLPRRLYDNRDSRRRRAV